MMTTLRDVSHVGEYVGEGRGDVAEDDCQLYTDQGDQLHQNPGGGEEEADGSFVVGDSHPLLVLFDCEITGFSIYADHITDIGAKVLNPPVPVDHLTLFSLVRTGRNISSAGNIYINYAYTCNVSVKNYCIFKGHRHH